MIFEFTGDLLASASPEAAAFLSFEDAVAPPEIGNSHGLLREVIDRHLSKVRFKGARGQYLDVIVPCGTSAARILLVGCGARTAFAKLGIERVAADAYRPMTALSPEAKRARPVAHGNVALISAATKTVCLLAALLSFQMASAISPPTEPDCHVGAYRNSHGDMLALGTTATEGALRYYLVDGRSGLLQPAPAHHYAAGPGWETKSPVVADAKLSFCGSQHIEFNIAGGPNGIWTKIPFRITNIRFVSNGTTLAGRLVEPPGGKRRPAVVLVQGSLDTPSLDREPWQWILPTAGISVFVYDKRGTGASEGIYTQDFVALADDAAAAVMQARKVGGGRFTRLGLQGLSQGGWVAPLAATKVSVDFLEIGYGVVGTPIEQDQWQVAYELTQKGFGPDILAKAHELTEETGRIAASNFERDLSELHAIQARSRGQSWITQFEGQYSGELVRGELATAREESPGVIWHYDAESVLRQLSIPQLWIMAADDSLAPSGPTIARLQRLRADGLPIQIAVFPDTDHGIRNFTVGPDGSHKRAQYAAGYFSLQIDWIKGHVAPLYGRASFLAAPEAH
jgi:pimeloyl-ACP methyl ester carboxylesterase